MNVHVITPAFAPSRILSQGLDNFYDTHDPLLKIRHWVIDQCYPLNRQENLKLITEDCAHYGITLLSPGRDLGLHAGFNWACERIDLRSDDVVILYDPDSGPTNQNWDSALVDALALDESLGIVSLMNPRSQKELIERGFEEERLSSATRRHGQEAFDLITWIAKVPVVTSVTAFRWDFLKECGGLTEPRKYYGHLESAMWTRLTLAKKRWAYLPDYGEEDSLRALHDVEYKNWKWLHSHKNSFRGSFGEYVAEGCPAPYDAPEQLP